MTELLSPSDKAALEIGRLFMRAHGAEQQAALLQQRVDELEAKVAAAEKTKT